ncbi:MAG: hypothetical protein MUE51_12005 [Thermoleophilia bacterium]|jgi:uncharacterized protein|nr:hypothetical protein [Thermoleophilia bacterium]
MSGPGGLGAVVAGLLACAGPSIDSRLHGEAHWRRVAVAGLGQAEARPDADALAVLCFALLHDACRWDDGHDPGHGPRAALLCREVVPAVAGITGARLEVLCRAIHDHTAGGVSDDATVACCWDADRLNLWRVGIRPRPDLLSGAWARDPERIAWGRRLQSEEVTWEAVCAGYARLLAPAASA